MNAHTIQELDIEAIDWMDPGAGKILSHWPEQRPSELSDEACTLCVDYLDMSVRLDLSASFWFRCILSLSRLARTSQGASPESGDVVRDLQSPPVVPGRDFAKCPLDTGQ